MEEADCEREEAAKDHKCRSLGELHGIPILLKDSIGTKDKLNTTCGSYTLLGSTMARDAGVVQRLRRAVLPFHMILQYGTCKEAMPIT